MALAKWMEGAGTTSSATSHFAAVDGARMHYLKVGNGPDLILVHGLLGSAACWEPCFEQLAAQSTVYAVDALGMGGSDRVEGLDVSLEATAGRLVSLMDAVGVERADLIGTSHGGAVVLMLAALYPERVRSMILHAPANPFSDIADPLIRFYRTALGRWFAHQVTEVPAQLQTLALGRMYGDARRLREGAAERYVGPLRVPGTVDYVLDILGRWFEDMQALREALTRVREVPTQLLWGDRDRAVSMASAEPLADCFDAASLVLLPGAGHLPFEEVPQAFCVAANAFLQERDRTATPVQSGPRLVPRRDAA
jgi:pimeloyl-ACP methyl ester carboxylesterase